MDNIYSDIYECINRIRSHNIKVTYGKRFNEKSDIWCFDLHNHPSDIEMIYFRAGVANIEIASETVLISPYNAIIYPEGVFHKETLSPFVHQEVICIRVQIDGGLRYSKPIHLVDKNQILWILFQKILEEFGTEESLINMSADFSRLLLVTCFVSHLETRSNHSFLDEVIDYLSDNYSLNVTVPQLAKMVHVSESYLTKSFKIRTGTSIIKYLTKLRIEIAMHLLVVSDLNIEQVSTLVGYNSPKFFCRSFKFYTNQTPSIYRKQGKKPL